MDGNIELIKELETILNLLRCNIINLHKENANLKKQIKKIYSELKILQNRINK